MKRAVGVLLLAVAATWLALGMRPGAADDARQAIGEATNTPARALTVFDYGALGDGKNDDTLAIQKAVDAGAGAVRFPRGRFRVTRPVVIDLDRVGPTSLVGEGAATIVMAGPGPAFKLLGTHQGTADPETVKPNVWLRQRTPLVDGLEIVGDHPEAEGVEVKGTMQAIISRVTIRKALNGVCLRDRNRNVIISECHVYENRGVGVLLEDLNLHQVNIANCHISYNGGGGVVARNSVIRNLQIAACDIESNMAPNQPATANILLDATAGSLREGAIVGCTIQHNHTAAGSANVRLLGQGPEAPYKVGHFTIADNAMSDVSVNIDLRHARGVTITGNTLWKAFAHNLWVEDCSNIVLGSNVCDRNPDYRPNDSPNAHVFVDCQDCTLNALHINHTLSTEAGLVLRRCQRMNVTNCVILNCDGGGLLLDDVSQCRVSDCLIDDTRPEVKNPLALKLTSGHGNMIVDNLLRGRAVIADDAGMVNDNLITAKESK